MYSNLSVNMLNLVKKKSPHFHKTAKKVISLLFCKLHKQTKAFGNNKSVMRAFKVAKILTCSHRPMFAWFTELMSTACNTHPVSCNSQLWVWLSRCVFWFRRVFERCFFQSSRSWSPHNKGDNTLFPASRSFAQSHQQRCRHPAIFRASPNAIRSCIPSGRLTLNRRVTLYLPKKFYSFPSHKGLISLVSRLNFNVF